MFPGGALMGAMGVKGAMCESPVIPMLIRCWHIATRGVLWQAMAVMARVHYGTGRTEKISTWLCPSEHR